MRVRAEKDLSSSGWWRPFYLLKYYLCYLFLWLLLYLYMLFWVGWVKKVELEYALPVPHRNVLLPMLRVCTFLPSSSLKLFVMLPKMIV